VGATLTSVDTRVTIARHDSALGRWEMASRHAPPGLRDHVSDYQGYVEATPQPLRRREPATADVTLIISFGPTIDVLDPAAPQRPAQRAASFVAGLSDAPVLIEHAGIQHGVEVNLTPLGARRLLGVPMHTLTNRVVALEDLLGPDATLLVERLYEAPGWAERFDVLDAAIARRLADAEGPSPAITWAYGRLCDTHGAVPVTELASELGWSRRHLGVRFRDEIGVPPKLLARILRFDRVVALLRRQDPDRWAEVAHGCGYYDQAHFNRDFREFAGTNPSAFVASRLPDGGGFAG
jgi:AraC-like DNA-binding protein